MFLDPLALSLSGAPSTQYNSVEVSRTMPSLLLKTFALRMAVMVTYGHLGTLQGLSDNWRTALPRMIILFVFPGATLAGDFLSRYVAISLKLPLKGEWSWRFVVLWAAGYNIEYQWKTVKHDGMTSVFDNISLLPFSSLSYTPLPWSWDRLILKSGRLISLTVVLAQAVASLVLVIRRLRLHAALILDSSNGIYAIIGILSVCHSFVLLAFDGQLEVRGNGIQSSTWANPHKVTITIFNDLPNLTGGDSWLFAIMIQLFWGIWPTQYMQGQVLLAGTPSRRLTDFMEGSIRKSLPVVPYVIIVASVFVACTGYCGQRLIHAYIRCRRNQDARTGAFWIRFVEDAHQFEAILWGMITHRVAVYLLAIRYELYVIKCGLETKTWGSDQWRWYDPWSDLLFVY